MLGELWYAGTIAAAFVVMLARTWPRLTLAEIAASSIPVGTIGGAWIVYLVAVLLSNIE
jgi:hypothetical protein